MRGHNPIFMDPYDGSVLGKPGDTQWESIRRAMGHARKIAQRVNLAALRPHGELASTKYCLASAGREYLVYQPKSNEPFSLKIAAGNFNYEWYKTANGDAGADGEITTGGGEQQFKAPFEGEAVLHLKAK